MSVVIPVGVMHVIQPMLHALDTESVSVTYAVRHTFDPILDAEAQALINALQAQWNAAGSMRDSFDSELRIDPPLGYYRQSVGAALKSVQAAAPAVNGLTAGTSPTSQVSVVITKRTAFVGRAFRGRMYLPWWVLESQVDETGRIAGADLTVRQTRTNQWVNAVNGLPEVDNLVLLHDELSPAAGTATAVTSWLVTGVVGTQRRRLRR